jgi:hypothetical protein
MRLRSAAQFRHPTKLPLHWAAQGRRESWELAVGQMETQGAAGVNSLLVVPEDLSVSHASQLSSPMSEYDIMVSVA